MSKKEAVEGGISCASRFLKTLLKYQSHGRKEETPILRIISEAIFDDVLVLGKARMAERCMEGSLS